MRGGPRYRIGIGRANREAHSLQFRVAGLSWPFKLLGRSVRSKVDFWVAQAGREGRIGA